MDFAKLEGPIHLKQVSVQDHARRERGIVKYSNRVQGFAYGGAAALVVIIGLRSVYGRAIPSWIVIGGLLLEATLLLMIAAVYYLTPEEAGGGQPSTNNMILSGEREILSILRTQILQGEREILSVLRNDLLAAQKEIASAIRTETETRTEQQKQLEGALHKESVERVHQQEDLLRALRRSGEATEQQVISLQRIDEQITMLLKNEIDNIVQAKVQEIFNGLIRLETEKKTDQRLNL